MRVLLRAEARVHCGAALHPHRMPGELEVSCLGQLVPDHAGHGAGAVAELQAQIFAAVAPRAALGLAHEQYLLDLDAVCELVYEHALTVKMVADGTSGLTRRRLAGAPARATRPRQSISRPRLHEGL